MGIKEQVEFAKEELTQDEKLLAGLIKAERFFKRHKKLIVGALIAAILGGAVYETSEYLRQRRLLQANEALLTLLKDPTDAAAQQTLKEKNPSLAALFEVHEAIAAGDTAALKRLASSKDRVVADLAKYHAAAYERSGEALKAYRMRTEVLLKDFALFNEAYLLLKEGKRDEALKRLAAIPESSPLHGAAKRLGHYGVADRGRR